MEVLNVIDRKSLVNFYLEIEWKKKSRTIPPTYGLLNWNDPNDLDSWLSANHYKQGVISGFKQWAHIRLSKEDLLDCAVVKSKNLFPSGERVLRKLVGTKEFEDWSPPDMNKPPVWFEPLGKGEFREEFTIILRAACPAEKKEGARMYVEDGSGRSICYLRSIMKSNAPSDMVGYIGFDPDCGSRFLSENFGGVFIINRSKYLTLENLLAEVG